MASTLTWTATDAGGVTTTVSKTFTDAGTLRLISDYHTFFEVNPDGSITTRTDVQVIGAILNYLVRAMIGDCRHVERAKAQAAIIEPTAIT